MRTGNKHLSGAPGGGGGTAVATPPAPAPAPVIVHDSGQRQFDPPAPPPPKPAVPPAGPPAAGAAKLTGQVTLPQEDWVPEELRGASLEQAIKWWNVMAQEFMEQQKAKQGGAPKAGANGNGASAAPVATPPNPADARAGFLADPEGTIRRLIREETQPLRESTASGAFERNIQSMRQRFPDFAHYEAEIVGSLRGATTEQLADPKVVENAFYWARGKVGAATPPAGAPRQPFFSEPPQGVGPVGSSPSALDEVMAKKFGISVEAYRANSGRR